MAFVPIPQTVRAVLKFQQGTDERQNVLHYKKITGDPTDADLTAICIKLKDWWDAVGKASAANTYALNSVVATDISTTGGHQNVLDVSPPIAGTRTSESTPGNVAVVGSLRTIRTGRRYRGRMYLGGISEDSVDAFSTLQGFYQLIAANAVANLVFGYVPTGFQLAVASKVVAAAEPVIRSVVENITDSQRRRLPKRGI